jgi:uncharacterized membrane protein
VATLAFFVVSKGKDYYVAPAFPLVLAAGAVAIESFSARRAWRWLRPALPAVMVAMTAVLLPIGLPVLSIENMLRYLD